MEQKKRRGRPPKSEQKAYSELNSIEVKKPEVENEKPKNTRVIRVHNGVNSADILESNLPLWEKKGFKKFAERD